MVKGVASWRCLLLHTVVLVQRAVLRRLLRLHGRGEGGDGDEVPSVSGGHGCSRGMHRGWWAGGTRWDEA